MSDEPVTPEEGEEEGGEESEEESAEVPPAGYIPGAPPIAGQSVGDRGEVETHLSEGGEEAAEPAPEEEPA